jgi:hypothetical protein
MPPPTHKPSIGFGSETAPAITDVVIIGMVISFAVVRSSPIAKDPRDVAGWSESPLASTLTKYRGFGGAE